jgi:phosphate uptake regulator
MAGTDDATEPAVRKVQRTGGSTFTVSLPKEWATNQGLSAGSTVYLYPFEDRVVVAPEERERGDRRVEIDAAGREPQAVARDVRGAYAAGFDAIAVVDGDGDLAPDRRSGAADALTSLVGMQIVDEGPAVLEGRNTLDASAVSLDQTIAQVRQQTLSALREAVRALVTGEDGAAGAAENRVAEVERLVSLVERQFQGALVDVREVDRLDGDRSAAYRQVSLAHALSNAATAAEAIAAVAVAQDEPPAPDLEERFLAAGDAVRTALRGAGEADRSALDAAGERIEDVDAALAATSDADAHRYGRALAALERATDAAGGLVSVGREAES